MKILTGVTVAVLATVALLGCSKDDEVQTGEPTRHTFDFTGTADPKYVGSWHTAGDISILDMKKDGSLDIVAVLVGPKGNTTSKLKGSWLVSGNDLLLKYQSNDGSDIVLKYAAELSGDQLHLKQSGNGVKTDYHRVK